MQLYSFLKPGDSKMEKSVSIDHLFENKYYFQNNYNVYKSVNCFSKKLSEDHLTKILGFGIDLDYANKKKLTREELIIQIKKTIGVLPKSIIETYKGYHLFFGLDYKLQKITIEKYKEIHKIINLLLNGNPKSRSIEATLKVPGYPDKSPSANGFLIKEIVSNPYEYLKEKDLKKIGIELEYIESVKIKKRKEKAIKKQLKENRNQSDLDLLNPLDFIKLLNNLHRENNNLFKSDINFIKKENDLYILNKLECTIEKNKENGNFEIVNAKNETVNLKQFYYNYYCPKKQENQDKFIGFNTLLKKLNTGIVLNFGADKISCSEQLIMEIFEEKEDKGSLLKLLVAIYKYININNLGKSKLNLIGEKQLLNELNLSNCKSNKKLLNKLLNKLNSYRFINSNGIGNHYFEIKKETGKRSAVLYGIKISMPNSMLIYLPISLLNLNKGLKDGSKVELATKIFTNLKKFKVYSLSFENIKGLLNYKGQDLKIKMRIKKVLTLLKNNDILKTFKYDQNTKRYNIW